MRLKNNIPQIWSIDKLLKANLVIPNYQRPYKWTDKNIIELLLDIQKSIYKQLLLNILQTISLKYGRNI